MKKLTISLLALAVIFGATEISWAKERPASRNLDRDRYEATSTGTGARADSRLPNTLPAIALPGGGYTPGLPSSCRSNPQTAHKCNDEITVSCEKPTASRTYKLKCGGEYEI